MENNDNKDIKQNSEPYRDNGKSTPFIENKDLILQLVNTPKNQQDIDTQLYIGELVLQQITPILEEKGQFFSVKSGEIKDKKFKPGYSYYNSGSMMGKEYGYVEGYVIRKSDGKKFGHSWNVDKNGNHIDFTFPDSDQYDYFGIIIPDKIVYEVGIENGNTWFSVLVSRKNL